MIAEKQDHRDVGRSMNSIMDSWGRAKPVFSNNDNTWQCDCLTDSSFGKVSAYLTISRSISLPHLVLRIFSFSTSRSPTVQPDNHFNISGPALSHAHTHTLILKSCLWSGTMLESRE